MDVSRATSRVRRTLPVHQHVRIGPAIPRSGARVLAKGVLELVDANFGDARVIELVPLARLEGLVSLEKEV